MRFFRNYQAINKLKSKYLLELEVGTGSFVFKHKLYDIGNVCACFCCRTNDPPDDQKTDGKDQAEFLGDCGEDKVGMIQGDVAGLSKAQAHAEKTAGADGDQRLHQLQALVGGVGPGVLPQRSGCPPKGRWWRTGPGSR